uniref:Putative g2/m phase-specific e3 ubiquitin-protein ligase n=1 Tax=Culex tarsalis TaxID=7177 RepID=A0A1Q3G0J9_CULTA
MEIPDDFLVDADSFYVGMDRLQYVSCRSCSRFTPFLVYLPPHDGIQHIVFGLQKDQLLLCPGCVPKRQVLLQMYPSIGESVICDSAVLAALQGFEYGNPFYRKYARLARTFVTIETRLNGELPANWSFLALDTRFETVRRLFAEIHLLENRKYSGLQEISAVLAAKAAEIQQFYGASQLPVKSPVRTEAIPVVEVQEQQDDCEMPANEMEVVDLLEDVGPSQEETQPLNATLQPYVAIDKRFKLTVLSSKTNYPCDICLLTEKDGLRYGEFVEKHLKRGTFRCHYFCLLSGTHIAQNGHETSGILGFLLSDIFSSYKKYRQNECSYCGQLSAAINCAEPSCSRKFHYICGYKNNCLTQFSGEFFSFCHEHVPIKHPETHHDRQTCLICKDEIGPYNPVTSFCTLCPPELETGETEIVWNHRLCLQKFAFQAGYYFKCPNCYEAKEFTEFARQQGIFVPMRDASWELEKHAFKDIHQYRCCAENCQLVGNKSGGKKREMVGCKACGGATMHMICAGLNDPSDYVCSDCMDATFIKLF